MDIEREIATANSPSSAQAVVALGIAASLVESLFRRGLIDQEAFDAIIKNAASYVQALCADCPPEVERQSHVILKELAKLATEPEATASA